MKNIQHRQRGVTLIVALIMLMLITLMVVTGLNLGKGSMQTVGNMQQRNQVNAAIDETLEEVISTTRFSDTPADVFFTPCNHVANTKCVDIDGDGATDVTVALTPAPACLTAQVIPATALNLAIAEDAGCVLGVTQDFGVANVVSGDSLCANSTWEIKAVGTDAVTQTTVNATQGVNLRVTTDNIPASC
jgi:Tfp pilus assembly protein PilX